MAGEGAAVQIDGEKRRNQLLLAKEGAIFSALRRHFMLPARES